MRVALKNISAFLIAVFAVFYCGNTVFIHSHLYQGHRITHSHPYLPGSEHSHNAVELAFIAQSNEIATGAIAPSDIVSPALQAVLLAVIECGVNIDLEPVEIAFCTVRGPPAAARTA